MALSTIDYSTEKIYKNYKNQTNCSNNIKTALIEYDNLETANSNGLKLSKGDIYICEEHVCMWDGENWQIFNKPQDLSEYQTINENLLTTNSKNIPSAINEINNKIEGNINPGLYSDKWEMIYNWNELKERFPEAFVIDANDKRAIVKNNNTNLTWFQEDPNKVSSFILVLGEDIDVIGESAFKACEQLTKIKLSNSLIEIQDQAFRECTALASITFGNNLTIIGKEVFYANENLNNVLLPNSVTSIGDKAFQGCTNLTNIYLNDNITSKECIFSKINIPSQLTQINASTFANNKNLNNIVLPYGLTTIESDAFQNCSALTNISIHNQVTSISASAFSGTALKKIH